MASSLGDISPAAGILTGKGMLGKLASSGLMGLLPRVIARDAQKQSAAEEEAKRLADEEKQEAAMLARAATPETPETQMKKGGKVTSSASKRGDGIAQRGKTRGKMY
jgi:hypothetical protein